MASQEQLAVSEQIKKVHLWLRRRTQQVGAEKAWQEHLERKNVLKDYATAMKTLAVDYWANTNQDEKKSYCRIEWVRKIVYDYFYNGIREHQIAKENTRFQVNMPLNRQNEKIRLLDVGSCYNPFKVFEFCETYAIDLCPASPDVKECNFLNIQVTNDQIWFENPVEKIPKCFFQVVVFCLFLEYLPSPCQRLESCKTAWEILENDGILLIITPDSNHQSANASLMKSWKIALTQIGFIRFRIEKLKYLYCMAFRKSQFREKYQNGDVVPEIMIPQDYVDYLKNDSYSESSSNGFNCSLKILSDEFE